MAGLLWVESFSSLPRPPYTSRVIHPERDTIPFQLDQLRPQHLPEIYTLFDYWFITHVRQQNTLGIMPDLIELDSYKRIITQSAHDYDQSRFFVPTLPETQQAIGIFGYSKDIHPSDRQMVGVFSGGGDIAHRDDLIQYRFFFMNPKYQGRGIGEKLFHHVFDKAFDQGLYHGFFFSHKRFQESWPFYDDHPYVRNIGTVTRHYQECRIYSVDLSQGISNNIM